MYPLQKCFIWRYLQVPLKIRRKSFNKRINIVLVIIFWNGSFIYYGKHLCERLKADIDSEYKAIDEYQKHICMINDPYVQKKFCEELY